MFLEIPFGAVRSKDVANSQKRNRLDFAVQRTTSQPKAVCSITFLFCTIPSLVADEQQHSTPFMLCCMVEPCDRGGVLDGFNEARSG